MKNFSILIFVAMLLLLAGCSTKDQTTAQTGGDTQETEQAGSQAETPVIKVEMKKYEFLPNPIMLKAGQETILEITSLDVEHGFDAPDIGVNRLSVGAGETTRVTVNPQAKGTFTVRCSVFCGEGHKEMKGTIIVE